MRLKRKWEEKGRKNLVIIQLEGLSTRAFFRVQSLARSKTDKNRAVTSNSIERYQNLIQNTYANILGYTSYATLSSGISWNIPQVTCIFSV